MHVLSSRRVTRSAAMVSLLALSVLSLTFVSLVADAQVEPRPKRSGSAYKVRIDSAPQQAAVYLDDEKYGIIGYTPWSGRLQRGAWKVILKLDGYELGTRVIEVKRTRNTQETFIPMVKKEQPGVVEVRADADRNAFDAEVWIDGELQGKVPATVGVRDGRHLVEVKKTGHETFRTWIEIKEGERVQVNPMLKSDKPAATGGTVKVLSNVDKAQVWVDGSERGGAPVQLTLSAGEHVVEVRAPGYRTRKDKVVVTDGAAIVLDMELSSGPDASSGTVDIVSPVPEADVFVDGKKIGQAPQRVHLSAGEHFIVVTKNGYQKMEKKINVVAGKEITVKAELANAGGLRLLSKPTGAEVVIDGISVGKTPLVRDDLGVGEHIVSIELRGYDSFQQSVAIAGGELQVINAQLEKTGSAPEQVRREQKELSSFGARTLGRGRSTIDVGAGYPHYLSASVTVGAGKIADKFGFDAGVLFRTLFVRNELAARARLNLLDVNPFSLGVFVVAGGGTATFDKSDRLGMFSDVGAAISLAGGGAVTISGKAYVNMWAERYCPEPGTGSFNNAIDTCKAYNDGTIDAADRADIDGLLGEDGLFDWDLGARFMLGFSVEIAIKQRWNLWFAIDGAPFQDERAAFTNYFYGSLFTTDPITYPRMGTTFKF